MLDFLKVPDLGKNRDKFLGTLNKKVGKDNWFWTFQVGKRVYSQQAGLQIYEDAFWKYLVDDLERAQRLVSYYDVMCINRHDLESTTNYKAQNQKEDHFNDIALRRCLSRLRLKFQGKELLSLYESEFSQNEVPFHLESGYTAASWMYSSRMIAVAIDMEDKIKLSEMMVK